MNQYLLQKILESFEMLISVWDAGRVERPEDDAVTRLVLELHRYNYLIWHEEDKARRTNARSLEIAAVKRNIDRLNQKRNDSIERVDEWLLKNSFGHLADLDLPMRTETPGSAFDRLSVLALKVFHMEEQTERADVQQTHINACRDRLRILRRQQMDLRESLQAMLSDLAGGKIRMKVYRQFKMYNDPDLNPEIYGNKE